jgi:hypothetical protein
MRAGVRGAALLVGVVTLGRHLTSNRSRREPTLLLRSADASAGSGVMFRGQGDCRTRQFSWARLLLISTLNH